MALIKNVCLWLLDNLIPDKVIPAGRGLSLLPGLTSAIS